MKYKIQAKVIFKNPDTKRIQEGKARGEKGKF